MTDINGNGSTWRWVVGITCGAFMTIGGWAWLSTTERLLELEKRDYSNGQRLAVEETQTLNMKWQLDRMEQKLDVLVRSKP